MTATPFQGVEYVGSHTGYSWVGQIITWGFLPWLLILHVIQQAWLPALRGWLVLVPAFAPGAIWLVAKVLGPSWVPWFYRHPGSMTISAQGISWRSAMPGFQAKEGRVPWESIEGIEGNFVRLWIVGKYDKRIVEIPADIRRLRLVGVAEDWSLAQLLVTSRPDEYVLTDPDYHGLPSGMRRRDSREPASDVQSKPLNRSSERIWAAFILVIYLSAFLRP
ncbi:MAG: hypothetical protein ACRDGI_02585 [Candidatus Limnocylindrales bacterium]